MNCHGSYWRINTISYQGREQGLWAVLMACIFHKAISSQREKNKETEEQVQRDTRS